MPTDIRKPEAWLQAGIDIFAKQGAEAIQAAKLSERLGLGEEAFYTLFHSEEAFLWQMLLYWRQEKTTGVIRSFGMVPVQYRLKKLVDLVFADRSLHDFLFYMRRLARENKDVARLLAQIEEERIGSTRLIFKGLGYSNVEIDIKGEILYSFYLGWYERNKYRSFSPELREEVLEQIEHFIHLRA